MNTERRLRATPALAFDVWKQGLRYDCQHFGKLGAFDAFGDLVLQLLWESGLEPTVRALLCSNFFIWQTARTRVEFGSHQLPRCFRVLKPTRKLSRRDL